MATATADFLGTLRNHVDNCGLSRYRICQECGFNQAMFSRFMAGERGMNGESISRLVDFLGLTIKPPSNWEKHFAGLRLDEPKFRRRCS